MWHLIATKTVLPSLKSAREHNQAPRTPQILKSDPHPQTLWDHFAEHINGGPVEMLNDVLLCSRGLPLKVTPDWSYWLVDDKVPEPKKAPIKSVGYFVLTTSKGRKVCLHYTSDGKTAGLTDEAGKPVEASELYGSEG